MSSQPSFRFSAAGEHIELAGPWTAAHAGEIERRIDLNPADGPARRVVFDAKGITAFDTFGASLLRRIMREAKAAGREVQLTGLAPNFAKLLDKMQSLGRVPGKMATAKFEFPSIFEALGRSVVGQGRELTPFASMLGELTAVGGRTIARARAFRLTSVVHQIDRVCWQAVPIILLITFLIGCILAQQGIFHFRKFGADIYVVDFVGILILREIGVLIVAIMVAGRSASSYTAELGAMKMREEIDALRTMGRDPVEILILPRVLALIVALPILTFLGSMSALCGAGLVAWLYGDMAPAIFIERLKEAITVTHFQVGIIKAPFMALVIGIVACSEGLRVKGSTESLGLQTTTSVVKSIFLVIVLDGLFAIFFASIGM